VNLAAGSGTFFLDRERIFPAGARRWWGGRPLNGLAIELSSRFDGTNETVVGNWLRDTYGTWLTPSTGNFLLGALSKSECTTIDEGLNEVIMDHLADVVDRNGVTEMVFRSGSTRAIQPSSWIVNCTGYVLVVDRPYEPYVSDSGSVIWIQQRSATMHLTSFMATS
jgi:hypothetical protein